MHIFNRATVDFQNFKVAPNRFLLPVTEFTLFSVLFLFNYNRITLVSHFFFSTSQVLSYLVYFFVVTFYKYNILSISIQAYMSDILNIVG